MGKLKVVLAAILMPFLYSIGCENPIIPIDISTDIYQYSDPAGSEASSGSGVEFIYDLEWAKAYWGKMTPEEVAYLHAHPEQAIYPLIEGNNPAVLFMGASTSMLAGVLLPVILLDVPVNQWDTYCTGLNNNRSSFGVKSFAFNKARSDYYDTHLIIGEGKPVLKNNKPVIVNPLLYKETDPLTGRVSVITYWKDGYYAIEHQKGSDNAVATKLSRAQSRAITKRLCEINKVTPSKTSNIEPLEMIYE